MSSVPESLVKRTGPDITAVRAAAFAILPVAPPPAPPPPLERVSHLVRRLSDIKRLQRIDDLVITNDASCCGGPQCGIGFGRAGVGCPRRKHRSLFGDRHVRIRPDVQRL